MTKTDVIGAAQAGSEAAVLPKSVLREYLETIVVFVLILMFARTFVFMQSKIPTESMLDTLLVGDYILVNRMLYGAPGDDGPLWLGQRPIARGDVIVFRFPRDPDVDFVKRVIGLPGDVVEVREGYAIVNGVPLDEPYVKLAERGRHGSTGPRRVPAGHYFVMGDNRDNSNDSRVWGFVPRSVIKGRAFFVWYSFKEQKNDHLNTGFKRLVSMSRKVIFFYSRTRWHRLFHRIE